MGLAYIKFSKELIIKIDFIVFQSTFKTDLSAGKMINQSSKSSKSNQSNYQSIIQTDLWNTPHIIFNIKCTTYYVQNNQIRNN